METAEERPSTPPVVKKTMPTKERIKNSKRVEAGKRSAEVRKLKQEELERLLTLKADMRSEPQTDSDAAQPEAPTITVTQALASTTPAGRLDNRRSSSR